MDRVRFAPVSALFVLAAASPLASQPAGDLLDAPISDAERTEVLVLGTPHLARLEALDATTLEPLLARLEAWGPAAVGVEELPPRVIAAMAAEPAFAPVLERFAGERYVHGRILQERLGLTWYEALAEADSLVRALGRATGDTAPLRRRLALRLLAGWEAESAALHWSILREEGAASGEVPDTTRAYLDALLDSPNESVRIGVTLARRLGLARVHPIDDHLDKDLFLAIADDLTEGIRETEAYAAFVERGLAADRAERVRRAHAAGDLLPLYREVNAPADLDADLEQWRLFFRTGLESGLDRTRVALWEARNLATATHVRRMTAPIPGRRALVVIGASHKPFLEAYLASGMDVEVVDTAAVLGPPVP